MADIRDNRTPNQLIHEKSPYLLQHAYNPVDWYPWGDEAFSKSKRENKPIFLSIGYSTCHWCHVMERESFEDAEVAALLNQYFVAIKVDREERPDIDHIYMMVCQALTGHGGWPMTVFLTSEQKPFFAGTYFPKERRFGHPGLVDLLQQIAMKWAEDPEEIDETSYKIMEHVHGQFRTIRRADPTTDVIDKAVQTFSETFDAEYGGFGEAPKFPTPHNLMFLLRYGWYHQQHDIVQMATQTLESMSRGGIYDHVGFGFSRYSVDEQWLVPHFEKMLYDNALLTIAFLEAYQVTGEDRFASVAQDVLTYVLRDMTSPDGGFYSAEDADSEGEEGKFYVWTPDEVKAVLGDDAGVQYCRYYGISEDGNFEGKSIPNRIQPSPDFPDGEGVGDTAWRQLVRQHNQQLFVAREARVHPHKDDKILTAWNGLMIAALAIAGRVLSQSDYTDAAIQATSFIQRRLTAEDGRLLARYRDGEAAYHGYVDDYAFYIWALIELYETTFSAEYLELAVGLQRDMLKLFWDAEHGGFFFYGEDAETLIARPKEVYDGATPSGNSVAALNLLRLSRLTGDTEFETVASKQMEALIGETVHYPAGYSFFMMALMFALYPSREVVIAGDSHQAAMQRLIDELHQMYLPSSVVVLHPDGEQSDHIEQLAPFLKGQISIQGRPTVYICQNFACHAPLTDLEQVIESLKTHAPL